MAEPGSNMSENLAASGSKLDSTNLLEGTGAANATGKAGLNMVPACVAFSTAVVCALTAEMIIWFIIYKHDDYKKLCKDFEE